MTLTDMVLVVAVFGGLAYLIMLKMKKKGHDPIAYFKEHMPKKQPVIQNMEGMHQVWHEKRIGI